MIKHIRNSVFGRKKYLAMALPLLMAAQAQSIQFDVGGISTTVDSQFSLGSSWRAENPDAVLRPVAEDDSGDDGNNNYDKGDAFSQIFKGSHDIHFKYENMGAFIRGKYWYDSALENNSVNRGNTGNVEIDPLTGALTYQNNKPLDDSGFDDLSKGSGATLLDAFVYGQFDLADMALDVRLGRQVVSWGESLLISGGINNINPADLSAFRRPGAEIKEGLLPVGMAYVNLGITDSLSAEAFYQYEYQNTITDPCGTYFSTSDIAAQGCDSLTVTDGLYSIARDQSLAIKPEDDGQFGIAFRYFADSIETEFGFYAMNVHSRLPLYNVNPDQSTTWGSLIDFAVTYSPDQATADYIQNAGDTFDAAAGWPAINGIAQGVATVQVDAGYAAAGIDAGTLAAILSYPAATVIDANGTTAGDFQAGYNAALAAATTEVLTGVPTIGRLVTSNYYMEFPEDQQLVGLSFSTNIAGIAVAGEVSHKIDMPVQINGTLLTDAVINRGYFDSSVNAGRAAAYAEIYGAIDAPTLDPTTDPLTYSGATQADEAIKGYRLFDVTQIQTTLIHTMSNVAGASQLAFLGEVGAQIVHDFDDVLLYGSGDEKGDANFDGKDKGYTTQTSWGYKAVLAATYNDVFAGVDIKPVVSWSHSVDGVSAGPGGPFNEGEQKLGLSVKAEYQNRYSASLAYTQYMDEDKVTDSFDRDYVSASVDVQF